MPMGMSQLITAGSVIWALCLDGLSSLSCFEPNHHIVDGHAWDGIVHGAHVPHTLSREKPDAQRFDPRF